MIKERLMVGLLTSVLLIGCISPVVTVNGAEVAILEEECIDETESDVRTAEADANGFVIEDGALTKYIGPGGDITIPDGVTSIGDRAFYKCMSLTSVTIPKSVTTIGVDVFELCPELSEIQVSSDNPNYTSENGILYKKDKSILICCPGGKTGDVIVPETVISIEDSAFFYCRKLNSITIQNGVTSIGNHAFRGSLVKKITIPKSVTSIGDRAFWECVCLTEIQVSSDNENYASEDGILYNKDKSTLICCPGGKTGEILIPGSVKNIGNAAFIHCCMDNVKIPESVISIGDDAFFDCDWIKDIIIPESVIQIGCWAFCGCDNLTSVKLSKNMTKIEQHTFASCMNLKNVVIPERVTSIEYYAFEGCTSLSYVVIPESVISIWEYVFDNCNENLIIYCKEGSYAEEYAKQHGIAYKYGKPEKLTQTITASDITKSVGDVEFSLNATTDGDGILTYVSDNTAVATVDANGKVTLVGDGIARIIITASETALYQSAEKIITITVMASDKTDTEISMPAKGTVLKSGKDSYKVTEKGETVAFTKTANKASSIKIPATVTIDNVTYKVTSIAGNAFKNNKKLAKVSIGSNVTTIGNTAFGGCSKLSTVTMGKSVTVIGTGAFKNCTALKKITISDKTTTIENSAFSGCKKLTSVTIGKDAKKIGKEAFKGCSKLGTITIKSTKLKSVGKNAFRGIKATAKIKVPAKKLSAYKKLLKGKGQGSKVKIVK